MSMDIGEMILKEES